MPPLTILNDFPPFNPRTTLQAGGINDPPTPGRKIKLPILRPDGRSATTEVLLRLDNEMEIDYYRHGGILDKALPHRLQK